MSAKEKEAAAKQTFTFLAPLTNEQPCEAGRTANDDHDSCDSSGE